MAFDPRSAVAFFQSDRGGELLASVDPGRIPDHVAIIMDGNGRWAAARGLPRLAGHKAGALAVREAIAAAIELGIGYLTIYSFSSENWRRPRDEVSGLMRLFVEVLERELVNLEERDVRVRVIGDLGDLPTTTASAFERCVERTADNTGMTLVVALNYGARNDILAATKALAEQVLEGGLRVQEIDEDLLASSLSTAGIPDPDLLVRTSGEMRISNFLLWEIAYSELWVTPVLWPDFSRDDLLQAVIDYQSRDRRFGGSK